MFLSWGLGVGLIHKISRSLASGVSYLFQKLFNVDLSIEDNTPGITTTFTRAGTAYHLQPDGTYVECAANEVRFAGARRVSEGVYSDMDELGDLLPGPFGLLMEPAATNYALNSAAPATHTTGVLPIGSYVCWIKGAGSVAVAAGTATLTGNGTATEGAPDTFSVTVAGTITLTVTGTVTWLQVEGGSVPTSRILTTTAAVTRAADSLSYTAPVTPNLTTLTDIDDNEYVYPDWDGVVPYGTWKQIESLRDTSGDFGFDVINTQTIAGQLSTLLGESVTVYWGDGTSNTYSGTDQSYSKNYGSVGSRKVRIVGSAAKLTKFTMTQSGANIAFALSALPRSLTYFYCEGSNTISGSLGDLPSGMTYFRCTGSNTVSGSLSDLPTGMTYFFCTGSNTISGSLSDLPTGMTYFRCAGSNTVSGSLSDLPTGMTYFRCAGSNTISDYTTRTWANNQNDIYHIPVAPGGLSTAEVDAMLIDLALVASWVSTKRVYLKGTNAARSSASDAAVATLQGKGVTVTTN